MSRSQPRGVAAVSAVCLVGLMLTLSSVAGAATAKYPSDPAARGFGGSQAGWSASSSVEGICLPPLLCPNVENTFQASGGADDGGFIRSAYTGVVGAMAVGGTSTGVWQSPPFRYTGVKGKPPTEVSFEMDRRADVDQLLAVSGNSATYSVRLVEVGNGGDSLDVIEPTTLAGANAWRGVTTSVDPDRLEEGGEYRIAVTSTYVTGTSVLVTGSADYDNVTLAAIRGSRSGGEGEGGDGGDGGGLTSQMLADLVLSATPGTATLASGSKSLFVPVKCPRKVKRACRMTVQGLLGKRKPATTRRTVKVSKGKSKLLKLAVKPKARDRVAKRKRLLVKQKVRVGKVTATVYKQRKLVRR